MIVQDKHPVCLKVDATTPSGKADILSRLNQDGAVVFQHPNSNNLRQDFNNGLGSCLGKLIHHKHSDGDGAVEIKTDPDKPLYISATSGDTGMHTDNSFGAQKVGVIALGCEKAVENEGLSKLVCARDIYRYLSRTNPKDLDLLFDPDVLTVERDGEIASKPIFSVNQQGRLQIAYRADDTAQIKIKPSAKKIFAEIREFVENYENQVIFGLKPGQILLVDNTAVLHGRSAFDPSKPRLLYRWWFDGSAPNVELGFTP
jgi:hypothetical protein